MSVAKKESSRKKKPDKFVSGSPKISRGEPPQGELLQAEQRQKLSNAPAALESHQDEHPRIDVRLLVQWLGTTGAKAGLMQSEVCSSEILNMIAKSLGASSDKRTRPQVIEEIVKAANRRIDKSLNELYQMSRSELLAYFQQKEPTSEELLDLLRGLDLNPKREGHKGLIELAAREISETGRFLRISSSTGRS